MSTEVDYKLLDDKWNQANTFLCSSVNSIRSHLPKSNDYIKNYIDSYT